MRKVEKIAFSMQFLLIAAGLLAHWMHNDFVLQICFSLCIGMGIFAFLAGCLRFYNKARSTNIKVGELLHFAIISYLTIIVTFSALYLVLGLFDEHAFNVRAFGRSLWEITPIYFSVITIYTVGYGDIYPVSAASQLAVMAEVVIGHAYSLTIFALLVSALNDRRR